MITAKAQRVVIYLDSDEQFRWKFVANNNKTLADGAEGYHNKADLIDSLEQVTGGYYQDLGEVDEDGQRLILGVIVRSSHVLRVESVE